MSEPVPHLSAALRGRYRVERELGEGGMATVYLARDERHKREVALKVLKPELAAAVGAERFLAEIEVTAHLQHPNILPLFDSGEADGLLYYVMPYVEGESLRDRLRREQQLPVAEAVQIATEIADALGHAHRGGVIHRDVTPANVLLRDGRPLVADFGVALAVGAAGGTRLTETGLSVGTPLYMSPEQATGDQSVGPPSDVYSLGCVLYEMLTGDPPYTGSTAQAVLGRIIQSEWVSATEARPRVPAHVDAALRRAMERIPADRFQTAEEFAGALNDPTFQHGPATAVDDGAVAHWRRRTQVVTGALAVMSILAVWSLLRSGPEFEGPVTRLSVRMPEAEAVGAQQRFDLSRDGSFMVYQGPVEEGIGRLWLRRWDQLDATPIEGTQVEAGTQTSSAGAARPGLGPYFAISPDGDDVALVAGNTLRVVPSGGGTSRSLADDAWFAPEWSADGRWIYYTGTGTGGLRRAPAAGGPSEAVTELDPEVYDGHFFPRAVPGREFLLVEVSTRTQDSVAVVDVETGQVRALFPGEHPRYSPTGHIVYGFPLVPRPRVMAVPFDAERREVTGPPVPVIENLHPSTGGWHHFAISDNGRLLYMDTADGSADQWTPVWVDREGTVEVIDPDWTFYPGESNRGVSISPEGDRVAVGLLDGSGQKDIYIKQLPRGPFPRLTTDPVNDLRPTWSPDGTSIIYISRRGADERSAGSADVWMRRADGTGDPTLLLDHEINTWEAEVSFDGRWVVARIGGQAGLTVQRDIVLSSSDDPTAVPILDSGFNEDAIALSPDGRWLAYESDETGRNEVYVRPFPEVNAGKSLVSVGGGVMPVWANTTNELFYVNAEGEVVAATFTADETFRVVEHAPLFELPPDLLFNRWESHALYDVSPDDERFMWLRSVGPKLDPELILVDNWTADLVGTAADGG